MANKFKEIQEEEIVEEVVEQPIQKKSSSPKKKGVLFKSLSSVFGGTFLSNESVVKYIPFVLFLSALGILYIANGYWADDKIRMQNKLISGNKELRSEYISSKSDLMFISKQSEVAKAVESMGLKEPVVPPMKIVVADSVNHR